MQSIVSLASGGGEGTRADLKIDDPTFVFNVDKTREKRKPKKH